MVGAQNANQSFLGPSRRVGAGRAVSQVFGSMVVKSLRQPRVAGSFQSRRVRPPSSLPFAELGLSTKSVHAAGRISMEL
jgi:hypothetical protein